MELSALTHKQKTNILNIALIILALIISLNIYKKQVKEIESIKAQKEVEIKKNKVLQEISQLEKRLVLYKNLLPKKDPSSVINNINNIAKESAIKIVSIRPAAEQKYPDYIIFPFDLVIKVANYHALGKFISRVESYTDVYMVEVANIRTEYGAKGLTVNLTISSITTTK